MPGQRRGAHEGIGQLSSAVEQTGDSVLITDRKGRIEYVNPAFERISGFTLDEVRGKTPRVLKSGIHDQAFYERLWNTLLAGKIYRAVLVNRKRSGELFHEEKVISPLRNPQGEITHFVSTGRDIFMSGYPDAALANHAALPPGAAFLAKPFTAATLTRTVREVLDRPPAPPRADGG